ncbi:hypothetical protein ABZ816_23465 [Actinosynnema sp. NPDC047251]|uniref:hypothetical protein n=1 Tax=Saccharothrix espanaensis TaxID=103731 RepID=UPI0002F1D992|nr:hypothetical protein [Saccharothrix espanaensis]
MTEDDSAPLTPDPPHSPGTPRLDNLDVEVPEVERTTPTDHDVIHDTDQDTAAAEPPD